MLLPWATRFGAGKPVADNDFLFLSSAIADLELYLHPHCCQLGARQIPLSRTLL